MEEINRLPQFLLDLFHNCKDMSYFKIMLKVRLKSSEKKRCSCKSLGN